MNNRKRPNWAITVALLAIMAAVLVPAVASTWSCYVDFQTYCQEYLSSCQAKCPNCQYPAVGYVRDQGTRNVVRAAYVTEIGLDDAVPTDPCWYSCLIIHCNATNEIWITGSAETYTNPYAEYCEGKLPLPGPGQ